MIQLVRIQPISNPATAVLSGIIGQRVYEMAEQHNPYEDPAVAAALLMSRLWAEDPKVFVLALVDPEKGVVGHFTASVTEHGRARWVIVQQIKADQNVEDAVKRAYEQCESWATDQGAKGLFGLTHRNAEAYARKYGFKQTHAVGYKLLGRDVE